MHVAENCYHKHPLRFPPTEFLSPLLMHVLILISSRTVLLVGIYRTEVIHAAESSKN